MLVAWSQTKRIEFLVRLGNKEKCVNGVDCKITITIETEVGWLGQ